MNHTNASPSNKTADLFDASNPLTNDFDAALTEHPTFPKHSSTKHAWWLLLLALICVNALLWFTYTSTRQVWGFSSEPVSSADIAPEKIVIPSATTTQPVSPPSPATSLPTPIPTGSSTVAPEKIVCMLWEFFTPNELKRADNRLAEQAWSGYTSESAQEPATYMVFIGPFESRTEMLTKIKILEKLKLKDFSQLPSGTISLGVLSTREAANSLKTSLSKRGLQGVQTLERTGKSNRTRYRFEGLSTDSLNALTTLSAELGLLRACS